MDSPIGDVLFVGPYISERVSRSIRVRDATVGDFLNSMSTKQKETVERIVKRIVQNERGNQCVKRRLSSPRAEYHAGDLNQKAFESLSTLLNWHKGRANVRYDRIQKRFRPRSASSKECACRTSSTCNGECIRSRTGGGCVPRNENAVGFVGVTNGTNQKERDGLAATQRSRIVPTPSLRRDPHSSLDLRSGHRRHVDYAKRMDGVYWRRHSPKVRKNLIRS
jgi:hypothetical protein